MKTQEYLDEVRRDLKLPSDYALQKPLGISKAQVSKYRTGKDSLSNSIAVRVAKLTNKNPLQVIAEVNFEKETDPDTKAVWAALLEKISKGFDVLRRHVSPRQLYV